MSMWEAVVLGVIQGLTEFLPISSTAHLLVARTLLHHPHPEDAFTTVIQLGTVVAVFWYFRSDVARLVRGFLADVRSLRIGSNPDGRMAWLIVLGTVPVVIVGLLFKKWIKDKDTFYNLPSIAWVSIVFALLLAVAEWWAHRRVRHGEVALGEAEVTWLDALWVGLWQALALMPGGSRSGTTITGGLFAGLSRPAAARFSFLLSLPAVLAAGVKELYDEYKTLQHPVAGEPPSLFASGDEMAALVVGTLVSAVVGYLAIAWLLHFLKRYSTAVFIVYRLLLGAAILGLLAAGVLKNS
ncbi:MAG TPA: undecaprenyl-diphosphatase UppP [Gemmataceae bacterium]|nr:undecaprenyl-diphosphatase UppP [Gemmataceae bacterium]